MRQIAKDEFLTPLRQDISNDKLRFVPNIFPHKGYPWNYGSFPKVFIPSCNHLRYYYYPNIRLTAQPPKRPGKTPQIYPP